MKKRMSDGRFRFNLTVFDEWQEQPVLKIKGMDEKVFKRVQAELRRKYG